MKDSLFFLSFKYQNIGLVIVAEGLHYGNSMGKMTEEENGRDKWRRESLSLQNHIIGNKNKQRKHERKTVLELGLVMQKQNLLLSISCGFY